ncbi:gliding motility protein GldN [Cyclobacteriaceae bacterium]|jgi:gliding motility associated protien GldN|nr:gliding motility protein GldN [Cyclobacteriaceae bacterium]|tara:strand:- start:887 stop:1720 length:834 start_codon:yes stop_codon:yes gene_type:complete
MKNLLFSFLIIAMVVEVQAQQRTAAEIIKPEVQDNYILFKKTLIRRMNLTEKQNAPFNAKNSELSALIIQGAKDGLLQPYMSDSCLRPMPDDEFISSLQYEIQGAGDDFGGGFGGGFGDEAEEEAEGDGKNYNDIDPTEFNKLYLKEDLIFDRNRSRMYYYIRSITLGIPANPNYEIQFEKRVASFKYDDIIKLLRGPYKEKALWYNEQNQGAHINLADALELRLFSAPIIGVSNSQNLDIRQMYADKIADDPMSAMVLQQQAEMELMEYESNLWEN